jgi:hypothetical protein
MREITTEAREVRLELCERERSMGERHRPCRPWQGRGRRPISGGWRQRKSRPAPPQRDLLSAATKGEDGGGLLQIPPRLLFQAPVQACMLACSIVWIGLPPPTLHPDPSIMQRASTQGATSINSPSTISPGKVRKTNRTCDKAEEAESPHGDASRSRLAISILNSECPLPLHFQSCVGGGRNESPDRATDCNVPLASEINQNRLNCATLSMREGPR